MAKLVSPKAELAVLRGMCSKNKHIAGTLLSSVDESHFYSEESVEVFQAIKRHMSEEGTAPSYRLLIEDPSLSDEAREHFRNSVASIQSPAEAVKAAKILNTYRQHRGLYNLAAHINQEYKKSKVDVDSLLENVSTALNIVRSKKSTQNSFIHFGRNNNSLDIVKSILYDDNSEDIIPTGIPEFDDVSGGFARGALVTIGATSGGGKSTVTNAIGMKMALMGYKVLMVPLEMSKKEMTARMMANTSKTDLTKIMTQRLASGEKDLVFKRHRRWERKVKEAGGRYTIFRPEEDMTIEEVMAATSAYQCDVKIIDYISLLKGADGDDQWRALGSMARYAKINAENDKCVNILVVQINDEGKIRYSRAITEHSSNSWTWVATKESKETGITKIEQPKSRNSLSFPFNIKINYSLMRVESLPQDESGLGTVTEEPTRSKDKPKRKKELPNLAADI